MRQLGAQSLRAICELDLPHLGPSSAERAVSELYREFSQEISVDS